MSALHTTFAGLRWLGYVVFCLVTITALAASWTGVALAAVAVVTAPPIGGLLLFFAIALAHVVKWGSDEVYRLASDLVDRLDRRFFPAVHTFDVEVPSSQPKPSCEWLVPEPTVQRVMAASSAVETQPATARTGGLSKEERRAELRAQLQAMSELQLQEVTASAMEAMAGNVSSFEHLRMRGLELDGVFSHLEVYLDAREVAVAGLEVLAQKRPPIESVLEQAGFKVMHHYASAEYIAAKSGAEVRGIHTRALARGIEKALRRRFRWRHVSYRLEEETRPLGWRIRRQSTPSTGHSEEVRSKEL